VSSGSLSWFERLLGRGKSSTPEIGVSPDPLPSKRRRDAPDLTKYAHMRERMRLRQERSVINRRHAEAIEQAREFAEDVPAMIQQSERKRRQEYMHTLDATLERLRRMERGEY